MSVHNRKPESSDVHILNLSSMFVKQPTASLEPSRCQPVLSLSELVVAGLIT